LIDRVESVRSCLAGLESHDMWMIESQFDRVLDPDDPLICRDPLRERIKQRGLTSAGSARNDDVASVVSETRQCLNYLAWRTLFEPNDRCAKPADGNHRAIDRNRVDSRVHTRPSWHLNAEG
jgi:hypothetical protein